MGGMAAAVTRYAVTSIDPVWISTFRFGIGFLLLLPFALATRSRWPRNADLIATAALGALFYGAYFVAYARALTFTTAARGSLGIATLPVLTMLVAAALGKERLTLRKSLGVLTALGGVAIAMLTDLSRAPVGAWKGDAMMVAAMLSMAVYTIYSRPLMARSSALGYACAGMAAGATLNATIAVSNNGWAALSAMGAQQWAAALFLGVVPGALGFFSMGLCGTANYANPSCSDDHHQPHLCRGSGRAPGVGAFRHRSPGGCRRRGGRDLDGVVMSDTPAGPHLGSECSALPALHAEARTSRRRLRRSL
jgi:drug/metabolite transporter (DMT)-like permease